LRDERDLEMRGSDSERIKKSFRTTGLGDFQGTEVRRQVPKGLFR
jgi:hypothetical protein